MTIDTEELREMSVEDRLQLLDAVWDSFDGDPLDLPLPESHKRELDRRMAYEEANSNSGVSWETVKNRLMREP
jgi:putative addiction module component (TIGR02574 family)